MGQSSVKRGGAGGGYDLANAANNSWYYHWSNDPNKTAEHAPILWGQMHGQYTPMIWGGNLGNIQNKIDRILGYKDSVGVEYVLGFNEPERKDQANLSVADAIAMWGVMDSQLADGGGLKLVSPAVSDNVAGRDWLADFMSQANANNYQVDAVAFHWYGDININNPAGTANNFLNRVDSYYNTYGLPVWITEFAGMDWGGNYTIQQMIDFNTAFLEVVIPGLESRAHVERYSWWQFGLGKTDPAAVADTQLFEQIDGVWTPTQIGDVYVETLMEGDNLWLTGASTGMDTIYMRGGLMSNSDTANPSVIYAIDAIEGDSEIGAGADAQTIVSGGTVRIRSGATLTKIYAGDVIFQDVEIINEGALHVRRDMELAGALTFGGDGSGDLIVESNGVLLISGDVSGMHSDLIIVGGGIVNMQASEAGAMTGGIDVQAGGALRIGTAGQDANVFPDNPTSFINNGTVRVFDEETIANMTGSGDLFAEEETVSLEDNAGFDGEIGVRDGATLRVINAAGLGSTAGKTVVYGDQQQGVFEFVGGLVTGAEPLELRGRQGSAINAPHLLNTSGNNTFAGPITLAVSGTRWTIQSDAGTLQLSGGIVASPDTLSRTLVLTGEGDGLFSASIQMNAAADNTLVKTGGGQWSLDATVTGIDHTVVQGGTLAINNGYNSPTIQVDDGGTLGGNGNLAGLLAVNSGGTVDPGGDADRGLTVALDAVFEAGATLSLGLSSAGAPGVDYDRFAVGGTLTVLPGAMLEVLLEEGFIPGAGDAFFLVSAAASFGAFDTLNLPTLDPGLAWDTALFDSNGLLTVSAALPGDADGDGDVDDSDLGTAFSNYTGPVGAAGGKTAAQGDNDGDGDVDDSDLGTAFSGYTGPLVPANVPEPASLGVLLTGGVLCFGRRRRMRPPR